MAKVVISEEKLNRIIEESIAEVLNEAMEDEGLGKALGNAYQWARNKWNNFKGDFNAGRNYQRYKNRNYDPYASYDNADEFRNLGGKEYAAHRYNVTADRNANARQWTTDKVGQKPQGAANGQPAAQQQNQIEPTGNPDVAQTAPQAQPAAQQGGQTQPVAQTANAQKRVGAGQQTAQGFVQKLKAGQPFMVTRSIKNYIRSAANMYAQQSQNKGPRVNTYNSVAQKIASIPDGQNIDPKTINSSQMVQLLNWYAQQKNWQLQEARIRKIVAESIKKYVQQR